MKYGDIIDSNNLDIGDMIGTFKKIADNPLANYLLQRTLTYCEKDDAIRLESALKLYLRKKENTCYKCKLMSKLIGYVVKKGATGFGTSESELKEVMEDEYWIRGLTSVLKGIALFGVKRPFVLEHLSK